jgi:hypothetical protein
VKEFANFESSHLPDHVTLGIIHQASDDFKQAKSGSIRVVQGGVRDMNLKYSEGDYRGAFASTEPEKLKRWQDAGLEWIARTRFPSPAEFAFVRMSKLRR